MSFIVKGIDFPEKCGDCPCCVEYDNGVCIYSDNYNTGMYCSAQDSAPDVDDINKKLNNCPLVEISTTHGRLVDADNLVKVLQNTLDNYPDNYNDRKTVEKLIVAVCKRYIENAPTIIEAEVSELSQ